MIILDSANSYGFSNATIKVIDNTYVEDTSAVQRTDVPDFNVLIPTVQKIGTTNVMELYRPGDVNGYVRDHGTPNALQYGFGPDFIHGILSRGASGVGVYTVNLRGPSATIANILVMMKYKVETDVPYTDGDGNQYYRDENNQLTLEPVSGGEIVRDVLHIKFVSGNLTECRSWTDVHDALNAAYTEEEDDEGYRTIPWFGVMYRGASEWANNTYFNMVPSRAEYDGNIYYKVNMFDGDTMRATEPTLSFDVDAGLRYGSSFYFENVFNSAFPTLRFLTAENSGDMIDLLNRYLYTVDDYLLGKMDEPSMVFSQIDPFTVDSFGIQVDAGSINPQLTNAFRLAGGNDGTETRDELFRMFFSGEIIGDVTSPLRYRFTYIPDVGYDADTKQAIRWLVKKRIRMTTASLMVGGHDSTFASALVDRQANFYENDPNIRLLAACQSPRMYNEFTRRTMRYPGTYFDTIALIEHFITWGNYYQPFAGMECRWTGFTEDTMPYPAENPVYLQSLQTSRINVVMKDCYDGAYLADQQMNTARWSDQTEFNNAFLISCMLQDLVMLIHRNHFKFNESEDVRRFDEAVNDCINSKYAQHSASISAVVSRVGTTGRARFTNKVSVTIDLKDINRFTDVELYLVDE